MEVFEKQRLKIFALPLLGSLAVGCSEGAPHPSFMQTEGGICESPPAYSSVYEGDPVAAADHSNWRWTVADLTETPEGVGYRATYGPTPEKQGGKRGLVLPSQGARERGLAMSIGKEEVVFGVTVVAAVGSLACNQPPKVVFSDVQQAEPQGVVKPPM